MTIYVDELKDYGWKQGPSCHMYSNLSLSELHNFAEKMGIGKSYFHNSQHFPHYDLTKRNRAKAVKGGADESTCRHAVSIKIKNKEVHNAQIRL